MLRSIISYSFIMLLLVGCSSATSNFKDIFVSGFEEEAVGKEKSLTNKELAGFFDGEWGENEVSENGEKGIKVQFYGTQNISVEDKKITVTLFMGTFNVDGKSRGNTYDLRFNGEKIKFTDASGGVYIRYKSKGRTKTYTKEKAKEEFKKRLGELLPFLSNKK